MCTVRNETFYFNLINKYMKVINIFLNKFRILKDLKYLQKVRSACALDILLKTVWQSADS